MKETQRRLFEFVKSCEVSDHAFTIEEASEASGLSVRSVRTYLYKKLVGRWVAVRDERTYKASGLLPVSPERFAAVMSQSGRAAVRDVGAWRASVLELFSYGLQHGFPVEKIVRELLDQANRERAP